MKYLYLFCALTFAATVNAWTIWDPHEPYVVKGKTAKQVYDLAKEMLAKHKKYDAEKITTEQGAVIDCIIVYVDGVEKFKDFKLGGGTYAKYNDYIANSLRYFNSAASLFECAAECNFEGSMQAWLDLGDLFMSKPQKVRIDDAYNRAIAAYAKAGELGSERGYCECAKIWLIPGSDTEEDRKTNASIYYRKAMNVCLKQGRKTDACLYVDKVRNLGFPTLASALMEDIQRVKSE